MQFCYWALLLLVSCFQLTWGDIAGNRRVLEDYRTGANFTGQLRLPKFAVPSRYELRLKPDLVNFTFSGSVKIELDIVSETKFLVYNAAALTIFLGEISFNSSKFDKVLKPSQSWQFEEDQIMVLEFDENLPVGSGVLSISNFQGTLNDELRGFYRSYYFVNGEKRYMAVTQFEPLDARRCFPCWDEPALKATFKITLDVPSDLMALSNMPLTEEKIDGNLKTVSYQESPVMSTYLVAVVVGLFDYVEDHTSDGAKVRVASVIAHELGHQWTGDLVTMEWWTHLWLNEGFATWLSSYAVSRMLPDSNTSLTFTKSNAGTLRTDALPTSHPIEVPIHNASEINGIFDAITYSKGAAVLRMLQTYLSPRVFQRSLAAYVKQYSWSNANTEDLWAVLGKVSAMPVRQVMSPWTKQAGFPLIYAKVHHQRLELKQTQFLSTGLHGNGKWTVPITLCCGSYQTCHSFLLNEKSESIDIKELAGCSCSKESEKDSEGCVLDDLEAISAAYQLPLTYLLTLMDAYADNPKDDELFNLLRITTGVAEIAADAAPEQMGCINKIFISLFKNSGQKLGWDPKQNYSLLNPSPRTSVLTTLALLGDEGTIQEATRRSLTSCPDAQIVLEALNFMISPMIPTRLSSVALSNPTRHGREITWLWLKDNWDSLLKIFDVEIDFIISNIVSPFASVEKASEVREFFATRALPSFADTVEKSIQQILKNARWVHSIQKEKNLAELLQNDVVLFFSQYVKKNFYSGTKLLLTEKKTIFFYNLTFPAIFCSGAGNFTGKLRLPKFAVPSRYELRLKPDLVNFTFTGSVNIELDIVSDTKFLVYNAVDLSIYLGDISFNSSKSDKVFKPIRSWQFGESDQIMILEFDESLPIGSAVLSISNFEGVLNDELRGFYRSSYEVNGQKKIMAVTQFEPLDARRCFPCWDEPALKATFKITLDVPSELMALSNMPIIDEKINGDLKTVSYQETPLMSTYLVAVVVGLFDYVEDHTSDGTKSFSIHFLDLYLVCVVSYCAYHLSSGAKVRVYCPVGKSDEGKYALGVAVKSLEIYKKFFVLPYALPKLDLIGIPDFSAGAMENWGLVTFRPSLLYLDPKFGSSETVASVIAHELGHQWTGDIVTMEWWTHLWLNEGFATWLSTYSLSRMYPEWRMWTAFAKSNAYTLRTDASPNSHPIEVDIQNTTQIEGMFDTITYDKGAAVLRMLQTYLSPRVFQRSLAAYIKAYSWSNANTEDLWGVLAKVSGKPVRHVMNSWTKQAGFPLISAKVSHQKLKLTQTQFLSTGAHGNGHWTVPITLCCGSYQTCHSFLLNKKSDSFDMKELAGSLTSCPDDQIVLESLNFVLSLGVPAIDAFVGLSTISLQGREVAWTWLKDNWDFLLKSFDSNIGSLISKIVSPFACKEKAVEVKKFFATRTKPSFSEAVEESIHQILRNARWVHSIQKEKHLKEIVLKLSGGNC
ncbi:hypothetical protein QQ045_003777 [Rhodiola kirilowii]